MARYIDADNFCGWLETLIKDFGEPNISIRPVAYGTLNALQNVLEVVRKQPGEEVVEVKHGEWVPFEIEECYGADEETIWYKCSVCGADALGRCPEDEYYSYPMRTDVCHKCGAKMKSEAKRA